MNTITIGIGAAGSAIAEVAVRLGFGQAMAMNSSSEDLDAVKLIDPARRIKLRTLDGAAKNRNSALAAFKTEYQNFLTNVNNAFNATGTIVVPDLIFVVASGGGGTGSGILPVASRILRKTYPDSFVIPVIVLPSLYERGIAQQNAIDCLRELGPTQDEKKDPSWKDFTIILADNTREQTDLLEKKYELINSNIVGNIQRLVSTTKTSRISNMDIADRKAMFSDPGIMVIGSATVKNDEESPIRAAIKRAIEATAMSADITASVKRVAIQVEASTSLYTEKNIVDAQSMFKNAAGVFEGYYGLDEPAVATEGKTGDGKVLVAFSGARLPEKVIREREAIIEDTFKVPTESAVEIAKGNKDLKSAWSSSTKSTPAAATEPAAQNFDDIFAGIEGERT